MESIHSSLCTLPGKDTGGEEERGGGGGFRESRFEFNDSIAWVRRRILYIRQTLHANGMGEADGHLLYDILEKFKQGEADSVPVLHVSVQRQALSAMQQML